MENSRSCCAHFVAWHSTAQQWDISRLQWIPIIVVIIIWNEPLFFMRGRSCCAAEATKLSSSSFWQTNNVDEKESKRKSEKLWTCQQHRTKQTTTRSSRMKMGASRRAAEKEENETLMETDWLGSRMGRTQPTTIIIITAERLYGKSRWLTRCMCCRRNGMEQQQLSRSFSGQRWHRTRRARRRIKRFFFQLFNIFFFLHNKKSFNRWSHDTHNCHSQLHSVAKNFIVSLLPQWTVKTAATLK